jgi:hypothetical protein
MFSTSCINASSSACLSWVSRERRWRILPTRRVGIRNVGTIAHASSANRQSMAKRTLTVATTVTRFVTTPTNVPITTPCTAPTSLFTRDRISPARVVV